MNTEPIEATAVVVRDDVPAMPVAVIAPNPLDMEPAKFASGLERRKANRALLMDWVRSALVENTDFGSIPTKRGPSKPSLWKPGAEKICGMLNVTVTFPTLGDYESAALEGKKLENLIVRCELIGPGGGVVACGVGSRSLAQDYGDLNKALKMACKSAHIDATLRMGGLSEVFTQDLENGLPDPPKPTIAQKYAEVFKATDFDTMMWEAARLAKTPPVVLQPAEVNETPAERKERFLAYFRPYGDAAREVFIQQAFILPTETIEDIDNVKLDKLSKAQVAALVLEVKQESRRMKERAPVLSEGDEQLPDDLHDPADFTPVHPDSEPWRKLIVPFGKNAGTQLGELPKGALKYYVCEWKPKPHEFKGKMYQPKESDVVFHKTLQRYAKEIVKRYGFDREGITP